MTPQILNQPDTHKVGTAYTDSGDDDESQPPNSRKAPIMEDTTGYDIYGGLAVNTFANYGCTCSPTAFGTPGAGRPQRGSGTLCGSVGTSLDGAV